MKNSHVNPSAVPLAAAKAIVSAGFAEDRRTSEFVQDQLNRWPGTRAQAAAPRLQPGEIPFTMRREEAEQRVKELEVQRRMMASAPAAPVVDRGIVQHFDRKLGTNGEGLGIKSTANASALGFMTHDEAAAFLASVDKGGGR